MCKNLISQFPKLSVLLICILVIRACFEFRASNLEFCLIFSSFQ